MLSPDQFSVEDHLHLAKEAAVRHVERIAELNSLTPRLMDTPIAHRGLEHHVMQGGQVMWDRTQAAAVASRNTPREMSSEDYRTVEDAVYQHGLVHAKKLGVPTKFARR